MSLVIILLLSIMLAFSMVRCEQLRRIVKRQEDHQTSREHTISMLHKQLDGAVFERDELLRQKELLTQRQNQVEHRPQKLSGAALRRANDRMNAQVAREMEGVPNSLVLKESVNG